MLQKPLSSQLVRFILTGCLNTGFSYSFYAALLYAGLNFILANLGALILGIIFSFHTQGGLVFDNRDGRLFGRFAAAWCVIFLLNTLLIYSMMQFGLNAYWAGAVAMAPTTILSFIVQKHLVFKAKPRAAGTIPTKRPS